MSLSYRNTKEIDFHDLENLNNVLLAHAVTPHRPGRLCSASSTTLLYVDNSKVPREVRWLDCSTSPPRPTSVRNITHTQQDNIYDICCIQHKDKQLLITTDKSDGINAYNTKSNKREWCVKGDLEGADENICPQRLMTDGRGHLFIIDKNNACIQMFSTDSVYMGPVLREKRFYELGEIQWCKATSSAVIIHRKGKFCQISKIQETPEIMEEPFESPTSKRSSDQLHGTTIETTQVQEDTDDQSLKGTDTDDTLIFDEPPTKKSRWDVTKRRPSISQFNCKGIFCTK